MVWQIKLKSSAKKRLDSLDKPTREKFRAFLNRLASCDNPRQTGKALQGNLKGLWRYRVGDYRLITQIKDSELIILVVEVGHRKEVYR